VLGWMSFLSVNSIELFILTYKGQSYEIFSIWNFLQSIPLGLCFMLISQTFSYKRTFVLSFCPKGLDQYRSLLLAWIWFDCSSKWNCSNWLFNLFYVSEVSLIR
jgi:hypothetical protein